MGRGSVPCLLATGEADKLTPPADAQALAAELTHASCHIVARAGHQLMQEQPAALHATVEGFLAFLAKRRAPPG